MLISRPLGRVQPGKLLFEARPTLGIHLWLIIRRNSSVKLLVARVRGAFVPQGARWGPPEVALPILLWVLVVVVGDIVDVEGLSCGFGWHVRHTAWHHALRWVRVN